MAPAANTTPLLEFFVTCPLGLEEALQRELPAIIDRPLKHGGGGVGFHGDLRHLYRTMLWSRVGSRVMLVLHRGPLRNQQDLYQQVHAIDWEQHFSPADSFMVRCTGQPTVVNNTHYAALLVKDAVVDRFRERGGERPSVDTDDPDFSITVHFGRNNCSVYLDMCGPGLHRRGYRRQGGGAPLRENIAAALLLLNDWPAQAAAGGGFIDPLCGSGTFAIEAALIAANIAPGLITPRDALARWRRHDAALWQAELAAARQARQDARYTGSIVACDKDGKALQTAQANAAAAGLAGMIQFMQRDVAAGLPPLPADARPGLLLTNPPYGKRLGAGEDLQALYYALGRQISALPGWRAAVLLEEAGLARALRLTPAASRPVQNGPITCTLVSFDVAAEQQALPDLQTVAGAVEENAQAFVNRLRKNLKHLEKWARREQIGCYRVYDKDLPEFALAVDIYEGEGDAGRWVHVQEYEAPAGVDPVKAQLRLQAACAALGDACQVAPRQVVVKTRRRQKEGGQYERQYTAYDQRGEFFPVREGPCLLRVNLSDYLDSGVFLDSRDIRRRIRQQAGGKRFLNLFCYTATASVQAAVGGAAATTSVDLSNTYLDWARENFLLNQISLTRHALLKADVMHWLAQQATAAQPARYDIILLDPPTVSRSKSMEDMLDVQRDHVRLIRDAARLLTPGGVLYFCTNYRRFRLDEAALAPLQAVDISAQTLPQDFSRNPRIHQCWQVQNPKESL